MNEAQLGAVRASFDHIKCPTEYDAVLKDQCVFSFDTPFSAGGLFVNLSTWQGFGEHFLAHDHGLQFDLGTLSHQFFVGAPGAGRSGSSLRFRFRP